MALFKRNKPEESKAPGYIVTGNDNAVSGGYLAQRPGNAGTAYADVHFVFEVVNRISSAGKTLPLKVFGIHESIKEEALGHPSALLLRRPNPETPRSLLIESTIQDLCLFGNAFWLKVRPLSGGAPMELWRLRPERMEPVLNSDGTIKEWKHVITQENIQRYDVRNIIHFRTANPVNDYIGLSPISALRYEVELGRDAEQAAIDLWANGVMTRGLLKMKGGLPEDRIDLLKRQFRAALTGKGNRFKTPVLEEGMEYTPLALNQKDAEFIATAKMTRERVAQAFGYPLPELYPGIPPNEIRKALYADAVIPYTVLIEETLELSLMTEWPEAVFPEFQTSHILDADITERFAAYKDGIYGGWLPPEWVQRKENIPPGMATYIPMNMAMVDEDGVPILPSNGQADTTDGFGGDQGQGLPSTGSGDAKAVEPKETKAAKRDNYVLKRIDLLDKQSQALEGRIRGIYKKEFAAVKKELGEKALTIDTASIERLLEESDEEVRALIADFVKRMSERTIEAASEFIETTPDLAAVHSLLAERTENALKYLRTGGSSNVLIESVHKAVVGELSKDDLAATISEYYDALATRASGVARTELAYAAEKSAQEAWTAAGIAEVEWLWAGTPCSTGVCDRLNGTKAPVNGGFAEGVSYPPSHPGCTCATAPVV